ncbi:MAG: hypothetical protein NTY07_02540 [Bacteroidia bacterium]|nr:hypothetical protein [Bacteroidia bacterium]
MKAKYKSSLIVILIFILGITGGMAQSRIIRGTVYNADGKPASGVNVSAHRMSGTPYFTSFDGKFELKIDAKSRYIKFTFNDREETLKIEGNTSDVIDFGKKAEAAAPIATTTGDVDLRTRAQLVQAGVKEYIETASIFEQFYKVGDYKSALAPWTVEYTKYPKSSDNIYIQGIKIYEDMISKASDAEKEPLLNKIMEIYDKRIQYFGNEGYNLGRKATLFLKYKLASADQMTDEQKKEVYKTGYKWLESSVDKLGNGAEAAVLLLLNRATALLFKTGELKADKVMAVYDKTIVIVDANLAKTPDDDNYEKAKAGINRAFVESGAVTCEVLVPMYQAEFAKNADDLTTLKKINYMLNHEDCSDSKLYADVAEKLYKLEPTSQSAFSMARLFLKRKNTAKAINYYEEAINTEKNKYEKANYCYELAQVIYGQKDFSRVRNYARQAISLNTEWGKPYILIGKIYAASAKTIGESDLQQRIVYCLAVDQFIKAKAVDPDVTAEANKEIAQYSQFFPGKEDAFFENIKAGSIFKVGGWINESTTVRLR